MRPMAFVGDPVRRLGAIPIERREYAREVAPEILGRVEIMRLDVGVERVDPHAERQVALELGGRAREHQVAALLGLPPQLGQQPGLADARLAFDRDACR